jgi:type II secretory pathway predicted ATPase ExeA
MYKKFFGLERNPFDLSPDPYFVFPTERTKEALAAVYYAVARRKGFVVVSGEVGTGKTLMVRCLLKLWKKQQVAFSNVFNPKLSTLDFLRFIAHDLGLQVAEPTKGNVLAALYEFLLAQAQKGSTTVLIVDEAHQLSMNALEEIRLLTNLETTQQKLVQIILVGQPELDRKLDSYELRQLKQRIAVRCQLAPLSEAETQTYIERRLRLAGAGERAAALIPRETGAAVYRYSQGVPRSINAICEQALIAAFARGSETIPPEIIEEVASYFRLRTAPQALEAESASEAPSQTTANALLQLVNSMEQALARPVIPHAGAAVLKTIIHQ